MSLQPRFSDVIPADTDRVAKASFPKGNPYLRLRDELGPIYRDEDFAGFYSHRGQPAYSPGRLALITVFQYMENLSDRRAAEAVRSRIDWKYALGLELADAGFDYSILCEFRSRLLRAEAGSLLLDRLLERLRKIGLVKARSRQRTDSTHVFGAIRQLNRIELLGETMRAALNELATVDPRWTKSVARPEWKKRYGPRVEQSRLPETKKKRSEYALEVGRDGLDLLEKLQEKGDTQLSNLPKIQILRAVWEQHFEQTDGGLQLADRRGRKKEAPPESNAPTEPGGQGLQITGSVESPYDPEARFCRRHGKGWVGYRVHLTETCDDKSPRVVTHVETTTAEVHEARRTSSIEKELVNKSLPPSLHLVDAAYVSADLLTESWQDRGIRLLGPPRKDPTWQAKTPGAFTHEDFTVDWDRQTVRCPEGKEASSWRAYKTQSGSCIRVRFRKSDCGTCPVRDLCTKAEARNLALRPRREYEALQAVRTLMRSEEGRQIYALWAGIEGTVSQGVRRFGLRQSRYWGLKKTHLQHVATAAALNLARIGAWLGEVPLAETRISRFGRLVG